MFLLDTSGLDGLIRIASFAALGFSLIGIGWLYSRYLPDTDAAVNPSSAASILRSPAMSSPDLALLSKRRFAPIFVVQFLGAFNDNLLRFAMVFLATFTIYRAEPARAEMLATLAAGLFTLPYFLFSSVAGQLADGLDKAKLIRWVKLAEIGIMAVALAGFRAPSIPILLGCVTAMGVHSAIFGPAKYSILPQHLRSTEIMGGTGLIEAGTFLAILGGQLLGGLVEPIQAGLIAVAIAVAGLVVSFLVPLRTARGAVARRRQHRAWHRGHSPRCTGRAAGVWLAILGISWFFSVGTVVTAQLTALAGNTLGAGPQVVSLFLLDLLRRRRAGCRHRQPAAQGRGLRPLRPGRRARHGGGADRSVGLRPHLHPRRCATGMAGVCRPAPGMADPRRHRDAGGRRRHLRGAALRDPADPCRVRRTARASLPPTTSSTRSPPSRSS